MPKKQSARSQTVEQPSAAQAAAAKYNEAAAGRMLSHSPRRSVQNRTPLLSFEVASPRYSDLELLAEDESEAIRAYRQCHGIPGTSLTCRVRLKGDDPRPQPNRLEGSRVER